MFLRKFSLLASLVAVLISCSGGDKDSKDISLYVSSFLKENKQAVIFGHLDISGILEKTDYKSHDMLEAVIGTELKSVGNGIDVSSPVYFVGEGPLKEDGSPNKLHLFIKVKNEDSLVKQMSGRSFDVNLAKDFSYTEDGDFVMGIRNNLAIVTITGEDYDAEALMKNNFKRVDGEAAGGKDDEILKTKGDFVLGMKLENLYGTSNTDLAKLDEKTRTEITEMVKDSYIATSFRFENGAAIVESKNHFNQKLKDQLFFRSDKTSKIYNKLNRGEGIMLAALAVNLDLDKMEEFSLKYSPETMQTINTYMGMDSGIVGLFGSKRILSKLGDGQFGLAFYGDPMENSLNVNSYWGATDSGKQLFKLVSQNIPMELDYQYEKDGVYGSGSFNLREGGDPNARIPLPKGCEVFGTKGITAFVNFRDVDMELFEFSGANRLLEIVEYATFEYDENGGKLYIKAKDGEENVLKQALNIMIDQLTMLIGQVEV